MKKIDEVQVLRVIEAAKLQQFLDEVHKDVSARKYAKRKAAVMAHNMRTHVLPANFSIGDFVLVANKNHSEGHKMSMKWLGPQQVVAAKSDWTFEVKDLINEKISIVHADRLKFYSDKDLQITKELIDTIDNNQPHYNEVLRILSLRFNRSLRRWEVQIKWKGFSHEQPTWEPVQNIHEDVPELLEQFFKSYKHQSQVERARMALRRFRERGV